MSEYSKKPGFFLEILKLVEYIPIDGNLPSNGRFADNLTMDSQFYFESIQRKGSFRDIIRLITRELAKEKEEDTTIKHILFPEQRYNQLHEIGCSYPVEYLFFDFCLAALDGDYLDAEAYLDTYGSRFRKRYEVYKWARKESKIML